MANRHISVPKSFANGDASEWFKRFDICSRANEWSDETKALKLPTLLEGEALATWLDLSEEEQANYGRAKTRMLEKMTPMKFVTLEEFHQRKLRPGEALPLFIHDLKKLLDRAMPDVDAAARGQLLLHQFLAGLPTAVSRQLRASGETKELEKDGGTGATTDGVRRPGARRGGDDRERSVEGAEGAGDGAHRAGGSTDH